MPVNDAVARLAFVYSARELLWKGIGILPELSDGGPIAETLARCAAVIKARLGWSLEEVLSGGAEKVADDRIDPTVTAVQIALTEGWRARGIVPQAVCGRSGGEFAAQYAAGGLSVENALEAPMRWTRLLPELRGTALTIAIEVDMARAEALRQACPAEFFVIADYTDAMSLIACTAGSVQRVVEFLRAQGVNHVATNFPYGPHSPLIDRWSSVFAEPPIEASAPDPGIAYYSAGHQAADRVPISHSTRLWRTARAPTNMGRTLARMIEDGYTVFIEISGRTTVDEQIRTRAEALGRRAVLLPTMRPRVSARAMMDQTQASLQRLGITPR